MNLQERTLVLGFKFAWRTFGFIPRTALRFLANSVADVIFARKGAGVCRLVFNISRVLNLSVDDKQTQIVARNAMRSYMRYWADMFAMTHRSNDYIKNQVIMRNITEFETAIKSGKGVVVSVTHSGNWDLAGAYIAMEYGGITTVAERLRPVELFDEFSKHRRSRNINILPHRGGNVPPSVALAEVLSKGKMIGLVSDRDMSHHGVEVDFFGHTSKMPLGAAKLAIENSAILIAASIYEEDTKTVIEFFPSIDTNNGDATQITQALARTFEKIVSAHPESWHMLQRIWLDMPKELADAR